MRISFDYDETLTTTKGQDMALNAIKNGDDVLILTARQESDSAPVYAMAEKLGIKKSNVYFTNGQDKWKFVLRLHIDKHVDNSQEQIDKIKKYTTAEGVLFK
jgi:RIO-like serine/threonine protein kinase